MLLLHLPRLIMLKPCLFSPQVVAVVMQIAIVAGIYVRGNVYDLHHNILDKFLAPLFP